MSESILSRKAGKGLNFDGLTGPLTFLYRNLADSISGPNRHKSGELIGNDFIDSQQFSQPTSLLLSLPVIVVVLVVIIVVVILVVVVDVIDVIVTFVTAVLFSGKNENALKSEGKFLCRQDREREKDRETEKQRNKDKRKK